MSGLPRFTRSAHLAVTHRPAPKSTHFARCRQGVKWTKHSFAGVFGVLCKQRSVSKLWQFRTQGGNVWFLYLAHPLLSQVELRKGEERATCYPVSGAGPHGWCSVEEPQDSHQQVGSALKINCYDLRSSWTEVGLLQLPLPSQEHSSQRWTDGSTN